MPFIMSGGRQKEKLHFHALCIIPSKRSFKLLKHVITINDVQKPLPIMTGAHRAQAFFNRVVTKLCFSKSCEPFRAAHCVIQRERKREGEKELRKGKSKKENERGKK